MASAELHEVVKCSICLNLYTDPVILTCGHNFCRECIKTYLDTKQSEDEDYSCPQCRKRFRGRPSLRKNTDLSNIAEKVKSAGQQNTKCSQHNRILEDYCTRDSTCICVLCWSEGRHRGHEVETLEEASEKKKKKLRKDLQKLITEREKTEKRIFDLTQRGKIATKHIAEIKKKVTALFKDIGKCLKELENRVRSELSRQAEQESIFKLIDNLEKQKEELSRKIERVEQLSTADPITVLQDRESYIHPEEDRGLPENEECGPDEFLLSVMLQKGLSDIEEMWNSRFPVPAQGTTITLNINTAANDVEISDDQKTAKSTDVSEIQPNPGDRFKNGQLLSTREFSSGKKYWIVEGSTSGTWAVGICYPNMRKKFTWIGQDCQSWAIMWTSGSYGVWHNNKTKLIDHTISSNSPKLLVYLDYEAGRLSFYDRSDGPRLLHTFTTTFTEPLRAAFQVNQNIADNSHSQIRVF